MKRQFLPIPILFILFLYSSLSFAGNTIYSWSVVPQFTGTAVHRDWTPVIRHIERQTGYKFRLVIFDTIPEFEKSFLNGEPDFAYMNPYHAVMAKDAQGYNAIIRNNKRLLTGIMVVRKDSHFDNVQQLMNARIAFPSPNAFAASLYMRALLSEKENIKFIPVYSGTHSNAYRKTLIGQTAASGAVKRTLYKERREVRQNLKIIYQTPGFPSHPLTAHKRVPEEVSLAVQSVILKMSRSEDGNKLLAAILLSNPIKVNYEIDYLPLKQLKLDKFLDGL